jgi:cytochrome b subunit of formate dehydrogenase
MERNKLNYWIDVLLIVCLIFVAVSGMVIYFAFVSGEPGQGRNLTFLGTTKGDWIPWHNYFGLAMIVLMLLHLILHFGWLKRMTVVIFNSKHQQIDA